MVTCDRVCCKEVLTFEGQSADCLFVADWIFPLDVLILLTQAMSVQSERMDGKHVTDS